MGSIVPCFRAWVRSFGRRTGMESDPSVPSPCGRGFTIRALFNFRLGVRGEKGDFLSVSGYALTPALSQRERVQRYLSCFTPNPLISVETIDSAKLRAMRITAGSSSLKKLRGSLANSYSPRKTKF